MVLMVLIFSTERILFPRAACPSKVVGLLHEEKVSDVDELDSVSFGCFGELYLWHFTIFPGSFLLAYSFTTQNAKTNKNNQTNKIKQKQSIQNIFSNYKAKIVTRILFRSVPFLEGSIFFSETASDPTKRKKKGKKLAAENLGVVLCLTQGISRVP